MKTYNKGIELLRIIAMFMILTVHITGAGGIIKVAESYGGVKYAIVSIIVVAFYCHVNCYALISGYVGLNSTFKFSKLINIWIQILFYSLGITLIALIFSDKITNEILLKSAMPIYNGIYWYMTAYFILLLVTPFINPTIRNMELKKLIRLVVTLLIFFSIIPTILGDFTTYIPINEGYSFLWIFILYIVGATLSRVDISRFKKPLLLIVVYVLLVMITAILKLTLGNSWLTYNSPTVFLSAVCLFLLFINLDLDRYKINFRLIGSLTLGVYLIHTQIYVYEHLLLEQFSFIGEFPFYIMILAIFFFSLLIYIILLCIDYIRVKLFNILKLNEKITKIFSKLDN